MSEENEDVEQAKGEGIDHERIGTLLEAMEPRRREALSASLGLVAGICLSFALWLPSGGWLLPLLAGTMVAGAIWPFCNRLWRDIAIGTVAPEIGARWGQADFASGWKAVELESFLAGLFDHRGMHFTAWRSAGDYRGVSYRLSETSLWHKRGRSRREVSHALVAEIAVPTHFPGSLELLPHAGLFGKVDDLVRRVSGDEEQRRSVDPQFDAVFDTMASANAPVEKLLTPAFRRVMLNLAGQHSGALFSARFEHGWFSLRLPVQRLTFASARLTTPMPDLAGEAEALWWELTVPHRLIDGLMGDHEGPLR